MATRALEELRKAVSIQNLPPLPTDIFESLTSVLSLLTATPAKQPSEGFILSYQELFTKQIVVLYEAYPSLTLRLSSSIITENFKSRLSALLKAEKSKNTVNQISAWEGLLRSILNGVQTYIDGGKADMIEIGRTFYKPCFGMLGSPLGLNLSARIRTQTYSLLADTAAGCARNRELLRQKATLGGTRLGGIIASTNEYLVLDSLFQILARLTPSSSDVIGRADLAKDVFQNAKARKTFGKNTCDQLAAFLKDAKGDQWEKTTDQFIAAISRTDKSKPQPFRLLSNAVHANSFVYLCPESLDRIYLDCTGFVVNIQDEDSIDCLEVDYSSIASVELREVSGDGTKKAFHVLLSLSSPPIKGLEPVMEPPVSGIRGHHVSFDISLEDSEDFKAALRARGMGALIHAVSSNGTYSNFKSSVLAEGPLDLNSIPMASLEEKSKEVETFYATSPEIQPSDHESSKTKSTREHMSLADPDEAVPLPKMPLHKTATSPRYKDGCSELIRDHHSVDKGCDAATEKTVHLSVTHLPLSKLIVDTDELLTDVESLDFAETTPMPGPGETEPVFDVGKQNRRAPMPEKKALSKGRNGQRSDETNPVSAGNTIQALSGSSKRRRAVDDSTGEETRRRKLAKTQPVYNSQLLRPQETATTRSTTKYTARARKSSPLHSYSETDFDVIPSTSRAYIPLKSDPSPDVLVNITDVKSTTTPMGHEVVRAAASNKGLKPTEPSGKKGKGTNVGERSHVSNKAKRPRKRATIIDSEDGVEDLPLKTTTVLLDEPKNGTTKVVAPSKVPLAVSLKNKGTTTKLTKAPWKSMVQLCPAEDTSLMLKDKATIEANKETIGIEEVVQALKSQPEEETKPLLELESLPRACPTISPPAPSEIDIDLAEAPCDDFDMNAVFDFDHVPVESAPEELLPHKPVVGVQKVNSEHNVSGAGMMSGSASPHAELEFIRRHKHSTLPGAVGPRVSEPPRGHNPLMYSPLACSPKEYATRHVETIDLTHVDDEENKGVLENILPTHTSIERQQDVYSTPARPTVKFARDTKPSPKYTSRTALKPRLPNDKAKAHSMIPRLRVNRGREEEDTTASRIDVTKSRQASRLPRKVQLPEIPRRHPQPTRLLSFDYDSEENDSEREMDADQKIVAVLDKIQEVILGNMSNKFNGATKHIREATTDLCLFAAEDIKGMRGESGEHGKGLVHLEEKYARFGRQIRNGFDEQNKINEDIDKRLRQAILDHDKHGLSRKMPKTLASRPKIFQSLTP